MSLPPTHRPIEPSEARHDTSSVSILLVAAAGAALAVSAALAAAGCSTAAETAPDPATAPSRSTIADRHGREPADRSVSCASPARSMADEQAEVSAETAGRVIETPVERGTRVGAGRAARAHLAVGDRRRSCRKPTPTRRRSKPASASPPAQPFDRDAGAGRDERQGVARSRRGGVQPHAGRCSIRRSISQSEFDQRRTQLEAARQSYQAAQNVADQSYRSLEAARARVSLARKAVADTAVRAPFDRPRRRAAGQRRRLRHARRSASPRSCASIRCASS